MILENQNKLFDNFGKVAVLMGGKSAEREISILSGLAVHEALSRNDIDAHIFDPKEQSILELIQEDFSRAFIALHGRGGEDGHIQGALEIIGLPYTGSGVLASALAMDKVRSKTVWRAVGLATPDFLEIKEASDLGKVESELGFPVMIKPVSEGSSLGATKVKKGAELEPAWEKAYASDSRVLAEKWIAGTEYTAAILHDQVLPIIRLETPREFYDYEAKYTETTTQYICPCGLKKGQEEIYSELAINAFSALGANGWGRIDFIVDNQKKAWLIELNTIPGLTKHSLVPMAAKQAGIEFDALVLTILQTSSSLSSVKGETF